MLSKYSTFTKVAFRGVSATFVITLLSACGGGGGETAIAPAAATSTSVSASPYGATGADLALKLDPTCALKYALNNAADLAGPDPLLSTQWHLKNTGQAQGKVGEDINVEGAWKSTLGEGVRIAIVDDALETVHSDLKSNIVVGGSFNYRPAVKGSSFPLPCGQEDRHGTAIAGIIGSRAANAIGTSGIAPKAQLVGFNALALDLTGDIADALTRDMDKNAIYNNSWGSEDDGELNDAESAFKEAINKGIREGRGGKGAVYVFPAGNGGCFVISGDSRCQRDNSNFDGYVNRLGVIAVGAINNQGTQPYYAENGANILVSAPAGDSQAGITTTSLKETFRGDFIGTSASAPMVSGVAALMLSVNPDLTWRDVPIILARSARRNDELGGEWVGKFSHRYGFGTVNATAAVEMAKTWKSVGTFSSLKTCTRSSNGAAALIPDNSAVLGSSVSLAECDISQIEYVEVSVDITHEYSGDLTIDLFSPNGAISNLASPRLCGKADRSTNTCGEYKNWQFGSVRHLDESSRGTWQLFVKDSRAGKSGVFNQWKMTVYGR